MKTVTYDLLGVQRSYIGGAGGADKKYPQGGEALVPSTRWCALDEIQGHDPDVLLSPTINAAFESILQHWKPRHRIAILSLCTSTRPYSLSRKWSTYIDLFAGRADLIIHSNGGVIPIEYEAEFPYLNYDAHGERKYDDLYVKIGIERVRRFFMQHRYDYIAFNFRPGMRNLRVADFVGPRLKRAGAVIDYRVVPSAQAYKVAQAQGFADKGYRMFPELWPGMLKELTDAVDEWSTDHVRKE